MQKIQGMAILTVRRGGVLGHVVRTHSGVKVATYYGPDSLERALARATDSAPAQSPAGVER
jgi:hypothetical protein